MNRFKRYSYISYLVLISFSAFNQSSHFQVNYHYSSSEAETAMDKACSIWSNILVSNVPIKINFYWVDASPFGFLGLTLSNGVKDFQNAPISNVWYPTSLAKAIAGNDLGISEVDMDIYIDSTRNWYMGTDGNCPLNQYHLVKVLLHEIGHGIGFYSVANLDQNGVGSFSTIIDPIVNSLASFSVPALNGEPLIYDLFLENLQGERLIDSLLYLNPSLALTAQFTGNSLYFNGLNAVNANNQSRPRLFAPSNFAFGSSILHLNESSFSASSPDGLMTPYSSTGETNLTPGPITLGILQDLGWSLQPLSVSSPPLNHNTLYQNHPNPFADITTISFHLKATSKVSINIYDIVGKKVNTLIDQDMESGLHQIKWNRKDQIGNTVPNGVYIYELKTPNQKLSRKLLVGV